jgi:hypothetical protein
MQKKMNYILGQFSFALLIVIFTGGRSKGDDFVIIAVVGSRTHP